MARIKQEVGVAELKAHLSEYLRQVRRGKAITVVDRQTPVARLVPVGTGFEPLVVRPPLRPFGKIEWPEPVEGPDIVETLLEERRNDR